MRAKLILTLLAIGILLFPFYFCWAGYQVGNGDEGADLEDAKPINEGILIETQKSALELLGKLNTTGISGLGKLVAELESSQIYLAEKDVTPLLKAEKEPTHSNTEGKVYARTFTESHAATRFFPVALSLSSQQLITLHIHEALHRSLNETIKGNEEAVSELALAITTPKATHDQIKNIIAKWDGNKEIKEDKDKGYFITRSQEEHFKNPSSIGYSMRQFVQSGKNSSYPIDRLHILQSILYPFGSRNVPLGFGLEFAFIEGKERGYMGPLSLSTNFKFWSKRDFSMHAFMNFDLNTLSSEEMKNSPFGRDIFKFGIGMHKSLSAFYIENALSISTPGQSDQKIGNIKYTYSYGTLVDAKIRLGIKIWKFDLGTYGEVHLADYFRVNGGAYQEDMGRYRIFSVGPEFSFTNEDLKVSIAGRHLLDSTKGVGYDTLGNIMGTGISGGSITGSMALLF